MRRTARRWIRDNQPWFHPQIASYRCHRTSPFTQNLRRQLTSLPWDLTHLLAPDAELWSELEQILHPKSPTCEGEEGGFWSQQEVWRGFKRSISVQEFQGSRSFLGQQWRAHSWYGSSKVHLPRLVPIASVTHEDMAKGLYNANPSRKWRSRGGRRTRSQRTLQGLS